MRVLAIIPAKTDSKRLPRKNLQKIKGKTLVEYSIDYAKASKYNPDIIISSESEEVWGIAKKHNTLFHKRLSTQLGNTEVTDVYIQVLTDIDRTYDYVVALQPDHPDREHSFDFCLEYLIENNYDDLITIEPNYKRSGSVRVFKYHFLKNDNVSRRIGCIKDSATDIHFEEDLELAKNRIYEYSS